MMVPPTKLDSPRYQPEFEETMVCSMESKVTLAFGHRLKMAARMLGRIIFGTTETLP